MSVPREAVLGDAAAIAAIWNPYIRDTTITFTDCEKTTSQVAQMIYQAKAAQDPFLVVQDARGITGFALAAPFRAGPGYAQTREITVILGQTRTGAGLGGKLLSALEARLTRAHVLVAGVSGSNPAAQRFFVAQGYDPGCVLPEVGFKFGQWLDLHLFLKKL